MALHECERKELLRLLEHCSARAVHVVFVLDHFLPKLFGLSEIISTCSGDNAARDHRHRRRWLCASRDRRPRYRSAGCRATGRKGWRLERCGDDRHMLRLASLFYPALLLLPEPPTHPSSLSRTTLFRRDLHRRWLLRSIRPQTGSRSSVRLSLAGPRCRHLCCLPSRQVQPASSASPSYQAGTAARISEKNPGGMCEYK